MLTCLLFQASTSVHASFGSLVSSSGSSYQWQWSMAGTAICNLCPHVCGLVIQRRLDDRVFGLPAALVYLFLPLPFFFVLLPFFLHDDHQSNREHRRTRVTDPSQILTQLEVSLDDVRQALHTLDPRKAPGCDGLPTRLIVMVADEIAPCVHHIFTLSLRTANLPPGNCQPSLQTAWEPTTGLQL